MPKQKWYERASVQSAFINGILPAFITAIIACIALVTTCTNSNKQLNLIEKQYQRDSIISTSQMQFLSKQINIANRSFSIDTLTYIKQLQLAKAQFDQLILNYSSQLKVTNCTFSNFKKVSQNFNNGITRYSTDIAITLTNIGYNNAHLMFTSFRDMATGEDYLRKIKDEKTFPDAAKRAPHEYYTDKQISPKEDYSISLRDTIYEIIDSTFTYHFWIVYRNDMKMVYDTYYKCRAKIPENSRVPISLIDQNNSFYPYSEKESLKILLMHQKAR